MKEFLLVISMWGHNGAEWEYIGNQFINQNLMTQRQCNKLIAEGQWESHSTNEYYDIQFHCFHKDETLKHEIRRKE